MFLPTLRRAPDRWPRLPQSCPPIDRDGEAVALRCRRADHPAPFAVGARRWGNTLVVCSVSGIGDPKKHPAHKSLSSMQPYLHARSPRFASLLLCGGLGDRAIFSSRRNARRINSEKLVFSPRALSSSSCWISRGSRNVTGTLPFGSFVLGIPMCMIVSYTLSTMNFLALSYWL